MNKQEVIEEIRIQAKYDFDYRTSLIRSDKAVELIKKIDESENRQAKEPQKVKVKQFVAEWYEEHKHNLSNSLWEFTVELNEKTIAKGVVYTKFESWFIDHPCSYEFITSMKDGYEVEKEPLYTVTINLDRKYHLVVDEGDGNDEISTTLTTSHGVLGYRYFLTEKEIKSADEKLWLIAVPVEEVVER
ncbi:DUF1642 domain-containing protein [Enterococcus faecium]|uniref:DUF1642 domain-containing protein n=1 Tax=Enterococcus faecium TaxID=1352 RepID=UPI000CF20169|nr:DUF1642 domain-containing protein [Enterococcus faecium]PQF25347.1 hypothetical protein CUS93_06415 [Enterococcus faecium]